ncbi:hypothetical protein [Riemerella anatipestifer]|uniref:Uncharacterized protein n=1 Tax=Riemerella anatipestifer TaxID=34085 RepID=A0AAP6H8Y6_RIEAN|nr:hypothetical protein [Riemerella anatipestifer]MCO7354063.1 hypothetical protein [Riemerella anatipestifer]MCU7571163.1 hypothetical protein [Riemerella anatipestifer]MCU7597560.1 hypothetical protein [Riemerella anatipestifer]MCW0494235.1 hypothetical protein [Riemerella anatipestifer]MCW0502252.1 hypothetical protein [Riemerella anatipestifer]
MSKNLPTIKDRILYFAEKEEVSKQEFFRKTDLKYSNFTGKSKESDLNSQSVAKILLTYRELNPMWLLVGEGEMKKNSGQNVRIEGQNKNLNNINGSSNVTISQNDISEIIEIQREMNNIIKTTQSQLSESQQQVSSLIEILKNK